MKKNLRLSTNTGLSILLMIVFVVLLLMSIVLVRTKLLQNTQDLGMSLAESIAAEEESRLVTFRTFLELGAQYLDQISENGGTSDALQQWLSSYFDKLTHIVGNNVIDPYAVISGEIVAANPWTGDSAYDYQQTDWYQQALQAQGELIFTNVYFDVITGDPVITAAKQLGHSGDVLAMDIFPRNMHQHSSSRILPDNCSLYVCDSVGTLVYSTNTSNVDPSKLQSYTDYLINGIQDGSLSQYDAFFEDLNGVKRGAYYASMTNGWTVIITVPLNSILMGDRNLIIYFMAGVSIILFTILAAMVIRDLVQNRKIRQADQTIHILGESFYAIYRINYQTGSYETIKNSQDLDPILRSRGSYSTLLRTIRDLVEPNTYEQFELCFSLGSIRQRVAEHIADYGGDYQRRFGDSYKWVNVRTLYDEKLAPDEVILCFREVDIEKRQQLQHTIILQEALDTARKSTKAKSAFFSHMSHDMRTPLNAIIGLSELAEQHLHDPEKMGDYMRKITFSGKQLLSLINDILELSRLENQGNKLQNSQFNIQTCVEDAASIFRGQAQSEQKEFEVSFDIQHSVVLGDPQKLTQILNNLISNAFKYSESGAEIRVSVREFDFQQYNKYQIVVEDTGIGMSQAFLEHLFEPYSRETQFSRHSTTGTGLGMPIVKSLVQQMSGEIMVESEQGKGSKFTVILPMPAVSDQPPIPESAPVQSPAVDLSGLHILLAEDNELNMEIATEILTMNGITVTQAVNGAEALRLFEAASPYTFDAILMDMQMPEMDGCEATQAIRHLDRPDAGEVPIIAVTANAFAEDIAKTTDAGMNGHISKPIDFQALCQTLQALIQQRHSGDTPL